MSENADPKELEKFAVLAAQWWDPLGEVKTLHQINPIRLRYINEKVDLSNKNILDIGCGGGILSESMAKQGGDVTGIDLNPSLLTVAKLHQHESGTNVSYLHTSAEDFAREHPNKFDIITCLELLEHVPDPLSIIRACSILTKPGGHLFFSTLNRNLKSYLFAILGAEYFLKILPKQTHEYSKFIRPSELANWTRQCNLIPCETKGITYQPLTKQFSLTDDISINYLFYATKP